MHVKAANSIIRILIVLVLQPKSRFEPHVMIKLCNGISLKMTTVTWQQQKKTCAKARKWVKVEMNFNKSRRIDETIRYYGHTAVIDRLLTINCVSITCSSFFNCQIRRPLANWSNQHQQNSPRRLFPDIDFIIDRPTLRRVFAQPPKTRQALIGRNLIPSHRLPA